MDTLKSLIKNNRKHPLTAKVVSDYMSRLKNVPDFLGIELDAFLSIKNPKKLMELFEKLQSNSIFRSKSIGVQGNIKTAFRRYIESVKQLNDIKPEAKRYLLELTLSHQEIKKNSKNPKEATKALVTSLSNLVEPNQGLKKLNKAVCNYLKLKDPKEIESIYNVSQNLLAGKYYEMVSEHFETTAKIIAIKTHIKVLKARNYR